MTEIRGEIVLVWRWWWPLLITIVDITGSRCRPVWQRAPALPAGRQGLEGLRALSSVATVRQSRWGQSAQPSSVWSLSALSHHTARSPRTGGRLWVARAADWSFTVRERKWSLYWEQTMGGSRAACVGRAGERSGPPGVSSPGLWGRSPPGVPVTPAVSAV